jgi:hypothetical protein
MNARTKEAFLAAGLQSGGTTLVSWCFLQRADMDGVLDLPHDALQSLPEVTTPRVWAKATIASFRYHEIAEFYRWDGWEVRPLLIVRDVRQVYASLRKKWYGMDGTTAEDPPLRLRLLRFLEDWREFSARQWPILRYEALLEDPETTLRATCCDLGLAWDPAMLTWPKPAADIADAGSGNQTFFDSLAQGGARQAIQRRPAGETHDIPGEVLEWMARHFADYDAANGYASETDAVGGADTAFGPPRFEGTRRDQTARELETTRRAQNRLRRILRHPVLGRAVQYWGRFVNRDFSDVWRPD